MRLCMAFDGTDRRERRICTLCIPYARRGPRPLMYAMCSITACRQHYPNPTGLVWGLWARTCILHSVNNDVCRRWCLDLASLEALCGCPPSPAMLQSLARGSDKGDRMLQTKANAGEETSSVRSASAAGAKEGSMWTLVHKQCSASKAPC